MESERVIRGSCLHSADLRDGTGIGAQTACQCVCRFGRIIAAPLFETWRLHGSSSNFPVVSQIAIKALLLCVQ